MIIACHRRHNDAGPEFSGTGRECWQEILQPFIPRFITEVWWDSFCLCNIQDVKYDYVSTNVSIKEMRKRFSWLMRKSIWLMLPNVLFDCGDVKFNPFPWTPTRASPGMRAPTFPCEQVAWSVSVCPHIICHVFPVYMWRVCVFRRSDRLDGRHARLIYDVFFGFSFQFVRWDTVWYRYAWQRYWQQAWACHSLCWCLCITIISGNISGLPKKGW